MVFHQARVAASGRFSGSVGTFRFVPPVGSVTGAVVAFLRRRWEAGFGGGPGIRRCLLNPYTTREGWGMSAVPIDR
jgi:hypothetical protein